MDFPDSHIPLHNAPADTAPVPVPQPEPIKSPLLPEKPKYKTTDASIARANERLAVVNAYQALLDGGKSQGEACHALGRRGIKISVATAEKWRKTYAAEGFAGLTGSNHLAGRPSAVKRLVESIGPKQAEKLLKDITATALDTRSAVLAARFRAAADTAPTALQELLNYREDGKPRRSKHNLPKSLRQIIAINPAMDLKHQGNRASALRGHTTSRKLDILPGDFWTSDDTTPIWGWWVPWDHAQGNPAYDKDTAEYRYGIKLLQGQLLPIIDVASNYCFTLALIARETSAYRAADIWALFGRAFAQFGLPRIGFQFERGSWEATLLKGQNVIVGEGDLSLPHRVGGFQMLPTNITAAHRNLHGADFPFPKTLQTVTSYLPKTKPVEGWFDRGQSLEGMLFGNLGRDQQRRPNERAKKLFEACKRGSADPRLHFRSAEETLAALTPLYHFLNSEPMEGETFRGVPNLLWERSLAENPLYMVPEESQYLFRRNWAVARVHGAQVRLTRKDEQDNTSTETYANGSALLPYEGKRVLCYWDHEDITSAAQIHDVESREFICLADNVAKVGFFFDAAQHGHDARRAYRNAVSTYYADLAARAPSRQLPPEIAARRGESAATLPPRAGRPVAASTPRGGGEPTSRTNLGAYAAPGASLGTVGRTTPTIDDDRNRAANDPRLAEFMDEALLETN